MTEFTSERLTELKAVAEAATPGRWQWMDGGVFHSTSFGWQPVDAARRERTAHRRLRPAHLARPDRRAGRQDLRGRAAWGDVPRADHTA